MTDNRKPADLRPLADSLRVYQLHLKEVLDALERRDMTPAQIKDQLGWIAEGLKELRKAPSL